MDYNLIEMDFKLATMQKFAKHYFCAMSGRITAIVTVYEIHILYRINYYKCVSINPIFFNSH